MSREMCRDSVSCCSLLPLPMQEGSSSGEEESDAERELAWKFGLFSDNDAAWRQRYAELVQYRELHGDAHVGFRWGGWAEEPSFPSH
jgi:hypothetical protein